MVITTVAPTAVIRVMVNSTAVLTVAIKAMASTIAWAKIAPIHRFQAKIRMIAVTRLMESTIAVRIVVTKATVNSTVALTVAIKAMASTIVQVNDMTHVLNGAKQNDFTQS